MSASEEKLIRRREAPRESRIRRVWRRLGFEIVSLLVVGIGLFLVLERANLREALASWSQYLFRLFVSGTSQLDLRLTAFFARLSISDVVGSLLMAGAIAAILLRVRWRLLNQAALSTLCCPRCGGVIHRAHRRMLDRLVCVFVPVRRYRCAKRDCRWNGLRVGRHKGG